MYSTDYNRYFESDSYFPSAARKRYVLQKYPSFRQPTSDHNPLNYSFRPITPVYYDQRYPPNAKRNVYEQSRTNYLDDQQRQMHPLVRDTQPAYVSGLQRNIDSSPISEVNFPMHQLGGNTRSTNDVQSGNPPKKSKRRILLNNLFDILAIAATCIIFALIYSLIKPSPRGFFCDDTSIRYPIKSDTIPMWLLGVYGGVGPIIIFLIVEIWVVRPFECGRRTHTNSVKKRRIDYLKTILQTIFLFGLGIAICFLITEVGKRTIGRLRPYYLTLCNPTWANIECTKIITTMSGQIFIPQYITNHNCDPRVSTKDLQEARLSFPSGHSSYSTYAFVFLFVYFEARLVCPKVQFLKPFLQCLCIAIAFYTCLSRVTDFKHHPSDVIGGAIIGFCIAVFAAVRIGTYLWSFGVYCETVDETQKDSLPEDERVPIPGIETKPNGALRANDHVQIESIRPNRQSSTVNPQYNTRPYNDTNSIPITETRQTPNRILHGGRRVSPTSEIERSNN